MSESFPPPALLARMAAVGITEEDLDEQFIQGGGPGGQKINKTSVCVRIVHRPSGREARCQESRQRETNRLLAREILCRKFEEEAAAAKLERQRLRALKRVEKRKPSPGEKRRRKESKQRRSSVKANRRRPPAGDP
jgi:protein subunit release factor B